MIRLGRACVLECVHVRVNVRALFIKLVLLKVKVVSFCAISKVHKRSTTKSSIILIIHLGGRNINFSDSQHKNKAHTKQNCLTNSPQSQNPRKFQNMRYIIHYPFLLWQTAVHLSATFGHLKNRILRNTYHSGQGRGRLHTRFDKRCDSEYI